MFVDDPDLVLKLHPTTQIGPGNPKCAEELMDVLSPICMMTVKDTPKFGLHCLLESSKEAGLSPNVNFCLSVRCRGLQKLGIVGFIRSVGGPTMLVYACHVKLSLNSCRPVPDGPPCRTRNSH